MELDLDDPKMLGVGFTAHFPLSVGGSMWLGGTMGSVEFGDILGILWQAL